MNTKAFLERIKIQVGLFLFLFNRHKAKVISKRKIFVRKSITKVYFESILEDIISKEQYFIQWQSEVWLFLHEFFHIIQVNKSTFKERVKQWWQDRKLPHDKRRYEIGANDWANSHYRKSPADICAEIDELLNQK